MRTNRGAITSDSRQLPLDFGQNVFYALCRCGALYGSETLAQVADGQMERLLDHCGDCLEGDTKLKWAQDVNGSLQREIDENKHGGVFAWSERLLAAYQSTRVTP